MGNMVVKNWFGDVSSRPAAVVEANSVADIVDVLKRRRKYPSPVRAVGSNHSTTACGTADGGTIIAMKMNRILALDEDSVTGIYPHAPPTVADIATLSQGPHQRAAAVASRRGGEDEVHRELERPGLLSQRLTSRLSLIHI